MEHVTICMDCALIAANSETGHGEAHDAAVVTDQQNIWGERVPFVAVTGEPFDSQVPCWLCGQDIAGERFPAIPTGHNL